MIFGSSKRGLPFVHRWETARWAFSATIAACFGASLTCDGQIEVNAYIPNSGSNNVSVIDTETNTVVGSPIAVGSIPFGVAVTPDGKFAYVTNGGSNSVSVINTATNTVVGSPIAVRAGPVGIAVTPDGKFAYVATRNNSVSVISTATNTVVGSTNPVGNSPTGVAVTPDGKFVYVTSDISKDAPSDFSKSVQVIDTATNTVVGSPIPDRGRDD